MECMRSAGFTLIELLVVISIISFLSAIGFVNYNSFSSNQVPVNAVGQIQSFLRLAQSNATSSTKCNGQGSTSWYLKFLNNTTIELRCNSSNSSDNLQKSYTLENSRIKSINCGSVVVSVPLTLNFSSGVGALTFSTATPLGACLPSDNWTFTIENILDTNKTKTFNISKGGAVNVQ